MTFFCLLLKEKYGFRKKRKEKDFLSLSIGINEITKKAYPMWESARILGFLSNIIR